MPFSPDALKVPLRDVLLLIPGGLGLLFSFLGASPSTAQVAVDPAWLPVIFCGVPILKDAAAGLFTRFDIKADVLVSIAPVSYTHLDVYKRQGMIRCREHIGQQEKHFA